MRAGLGWIVDAASRGDVDRLDWTQWPEVLRQRVKAGRIRRLSGKWLRAGGREDGVQTHPETGVVQGGDLSPRFAKRFLPHVRDAGFAREVRPRRTGRGVLLRVADDVVLGGERDGDARKRLAVRPKRVARSGVRMHPTKTMVLAFKTPEAQQASAQGHGTCDCLGFTHDWTQSRRGCWVVKRRTARRRLRRPTQSLWRGCRTPRHAPRLYQSQRRCSTPRGALPVRWCPRALPPAWGGSPRGGEGVVILAESPSPHEFEWLGEGPAAAGDLCAASPKERPHYLRGHAGQPSEAPEW
jgi:RNA-directed DNA polymerase